MSRKIRDGWRRMFDFLQKAPYNGILSKLGEMFGIGNNIAPTLHQMGIIQETPDGWIIPPNVRQTAKMWDRVKELYPLTKEEREAILAQRGGLFTPASVAANQNALIEELDRAAPIAPTLRQHCAEKTYTKQEVIDRFKAFYIREYDKMDDRAYTLCGFLLESLEEAI